MRLFRHVIRKRLARLHKKGVKIKVIGDISKFDKDIGKSLEDVVEKTKNNTKITVIFALNYGGRDEIIRAVNKFLTTDPSVTHKGGSLFTHRIPPKPGEGGQLTTDTFSRFLDTSGIPDPELIIRPGGENRLSGFLLWQSQYSELYFPSWYMPDFTPERLDEAIDEYYRRQRRFGK